ncbi:MAG: MoCo/4Fe-4S cofactor protein with predicted Tat translocation signal [Bacteroidia bacterium]|jgi:MoCo/4Fe-4S cofactor protein with predicted Tat translocation signal
MSNSENKYWRGIEELEANPATLEKIGNEFSDKLPMEEILGDSEELSSNRRDFLKFFGFSVSAVALAACNKTPVKYAMPYIDKPEGVTPGHALYYATTCGVYNEGFPVMAKVREGRPIKLDGNTNSVLSQGAINAAGQASILSLYDVNRLPQPQVEGTDVEDWKEVDKKVDGILKGAAGKDIYVVSRTVTSPILKASIEKFMSAHNAKHIVYDPISYSGITKANKESFGASVIPSYHFDKADVIVSFGADFLGTWVSPTRFTADYSKNRVPTPDKPEMSKHYQIESLLSLTGTNADYRYSIAPSMQGKYLVSLFNMLSGAGGDLELPGNALKQIATELKAANGRAIVVCGSNDKNDQIMVNAINDLLGSYGNTIDLDASMNISSYDEAAFDAFASKAGSAGAIVLVGANPVYSYHKGAALGAAFAKVPVISTAMVIDESSNGAAVHAPNNHTLESWDVYEPMNGHFVTSQPVISKVFNTRSTAESLTSWSGESVAMDEDQASHKWVADFISNTLGADVNKAFHDGTVQKSTDTVPTTFNGSASSAANAIAAAYKKPSGFELALYQKVGVLDGDSAMNPWCHELPDPVTKVTYDNYISISRHDAESNEWEQGDILKVTANGAEIDKLPLMIQPGQARGVIGIALGYGRNVQTTLDNDLVDLGKNAYPMVQGSSNTTNYQGSNVSLEKVDSGYEFAQTQTHHMIEGRDYLKEATIDEYKNDNAVRNEKDFETISLWSDYDYSKGHHWAMAIDMNACTGCGSCVVSCHIENNVPVVGRAEVRRRRDMHWLRIDRYYSFEADANETASVRVGPSNVNQEFKKGEFSTMENELAGLDKNSAKGDKDYGHYDSVKVVHQPVMCQHCDHAPCETVCPVLATTHSSEGVNQMTYNRCIGTKYCGNNCPYKVRRFNWFRYNKNSKFDYHFNNELGRMVLNPDVTVRSRGVMEKCSFCIQNIQMGKLNAKIENRKLADGDAQTACAKACPSNAIVFGDRNDPNSRIAKMYKNDRSYKMLEEIGTDPSVLYLTKIRNRKEEVQS